MVDSITFYNNVAKLMDNTIEETRKIIKQLPKQENDGEVSVSPGRALTPEKKSQKSDIESMLNEPCKVQVFLSGDKKSLFVTQEFTLRRKINDNEMQMLEEVIHSSKINSQVSLTRV